jgi:[NiFe] hydrogenase assembly HybE family chaperone
MSWKDEQSLTSALEGAFERIWRQRMSGLPIINPNLSVRAIAFQAYRVHWLGVLITPWFMNLICVALREMPESQLPCGEKAIHHFPAGAFEFISCEEPDIGRYQMCSLFSPMFEFGDQRTAEQTAEVVMQQLLALPQAEAAATMSRRDLLRGAFAKGRHNAAADRGKLR